MYVFASPEAANRTLRWVTKDARAPLSRVPASEMEKGIVTAIFSFSVTHAYFVPGGQVPDAKREASQRKKGNKKKARNLKRSALQANEPIIDESSGSSVSDFTMLHFSSVEAEADAALRGEERS